MATPKAVWGIDIGQRALKAVKLRSADGQAQVEAFDVVEHPEILSQPDADRPALIRSALEQFLSRNSVAGAEVAVAVPGQSSFTRFVKLPPVEKKKIPEIVRFEAEQQIPFPIDDVIWRWQTFQDEDSPDIELGIFAMKKIDVADALQHFRDAEMDVDYVQMAPLALYNFMTFDGQLANDGATLLIDVGADKTDLVVADGASIWTRTLQIGGNNFTEALVRGFKLSFAKAEKLKRTAASSKYARQVFQTMRPVFSDLAQEITRSMGFYTSLHREARFKRIVGLGSGFRLPGLQKFLEQNLNVPVSRVDSFNKLTYAGSVNAPSFNENALSFAVAYGLAVQGLGQGAISTNLLPDDVASKRRWSQKRPWFAAAAAVLLVAMAGPLIRSYQDRGALAEGASTSIRQAEQVKRRFDRRKREYSQVAGKGTEEMAQINRQLKLFGYRSYWPTVQKLFYEAVTQVATDQAAYQQIVTAKDKAAQDRAIAQLKLRPRDQRRLVFIEGFEPEYVADVTKVSRTDLRNGIRAKLGMQALREVDISEQEQDDEGRGGMYNMNRGQSNRNQAQQPAAGGPGFIVNVVCRTTLDMNSAVQQIGTPLANLLVQVGNADPNADPLRLPPPLRRMASDMKVLKVVDIEQTATTVADSGNLRSGSGSSSSRYRSSRRPSRSITMGRGGTDMRYRGATPDRGTPVEETVVENPDPIFTDESMSSDTRFGIALLISIEDDGLELPSPDEAMNR
jgi:type IV pilus assembly protein PilM